MPEESILVIQVSFHFCAKCAVDVLWALSTFITVVRLLFPPQSWMCRSFTVWTCQYQGCEWCSSCVGVCSKQCWTRGYWSSSSIADNPIKSIELHFAVILVNNLFLHDHCPTHKIKSPPPTSLIRQNALFGFRLLVQMTVLLSSFV